MSISGKNYFHGFVWAVGLFLVSIFLISGGVQAQVLYGSLAGNVTDSTGAIVPGVEVVVVNKDTGYKQSGVSDDTGAYLIRNLPAGTYSLKADLQGFKAFVDDNVVVVVGNVSRRNVALQVGEISESITVSGLGTLLQTDTAEVKVNLGSKAITNLPLNSFRNYQALLNLVPGATPAVFQNAITDTPGRSLSTNVNGTARNNNNTRIDGAQSVNIWLPHHTAYVPPSETLEVVNISTNNFDAEQGFAGGAAITVVTKSGTNDIHGSLFGYHESSIFNARNFFNYIDSDGDGKADVPSGPRNIDGFAVGGPIFKDRLFFFGGWEGVFQRLARTQTVTVPTAPQRIGDFSAFLPGNSGGLTAATIYDPNTGNPDGTGRTAFPNNIIPTNRISPTAFEVNKILPLPNLPGVVNNYGVSGVEAMDRHNIDGKVDWYRTTGHRIWGKFSWMDAEVAKTSLFGNGGGGAIGGGGDGVGLTDVKVYGIGHTMTLSSNFLVDGNFGFTDMDQEVLTADIGLGNFGSQVLGIPGTNAAAGQEKACIVNGVNRCAGVPRLSVSGFATMGQVDGWSPLFRDENSFTFAHNFSWSKSKHEVRFGYDLVKHMLDHWQPEIGSGPRGALNFSSNTTALKGGPTARAQNGWASFLLGVPSSMGKSLQWELMTANEWQHAWYLRDRWQVTPKLTFTIGLRYEYYPLVTRDDRPMEYLDLSTFEMVLDNKIKVSKSLIAPRLGLAYRVSDNDVLRAGYGITYDPLPFARPLRGFYPLTVAGDFSAQDSFVPFRTVAEGIPIFVGTDTRPGARVPLPSFVEQRTMPADTIHRGYIQSWNFVYERKFPSDFVISVGYVGTQSTNQLADHQLNWSPPGGGNTGRQLFPKSTTNIMFWDGWLSSNYHSMQVAVNRQYTNGLFVKGAYTYSRAINMTDDDGWAGVGWNDPALISRNRAEAGYNRPHMLQMATIYELPFGKNGDSFASKVIQGWQVNGIFSVNENTPFTVGTGSPINNRSNSQTADQVKADVQTLGGIRDTPYYDPTAFVPVTRVPGATTGSRCTNFDCYGNSGRNILRGPTWVNLDLSIFRKFRITEDVGLEFRSEFFNFTNTPHFGNPNASADSNAFMRISGTNSNAPERYIRFGLKLAF